MTKKIELERHSYNGVDIVGKLPDFSRPVLFLDFDGVINLDCSSNDKRIRGKGVIRKTVSIPTYKDEWKDFIVSKIKIKYHPDIVDAIKDMNAVWITSWKDLTQTTLNKHLDYDFGYVDWKYRSPSDWGMYGKALAVGTISRATGCKWCVADDDMGDMESSISFESGTEGRVFVPKSNVGITLPELEEIREYLNMT